MVDGGGSEPEAIFELVEDVGFSLRIERLPFSSGVLAFGECSEKTHQRRMTGVIDAANPDRFEALVSDAWMPPPMEGGAVLADTEQFLDIAEREDFFGTRIDHRPCPRHVTNLVADRATRFRLRSSKFGHKLVSGGFLGAR
jgi:hypothetical protein